MAAREPAAAILNAGMRSSNYGTILTTVPSGTSFQISSISASVTARAVYEFTRFWALGSGEAVALGAMAAVYGRIDSPQEIAAAALAAVKELEVDDRRAPEILTLKAPQIIAVPTPLPSLPLKFPRRGLRVWRVSGSFRRRASRGIGRGDL